VLTPEEIEQCRESIRDCTRRDFSVLEELRTEIRPLRSRSIAIKPRSATAVSLVAADGGNNRLEYDPFMFHFVRVNDSYGKLLSLEIISPTTDTDLLSARQFDSDGNPVTDLGRLMSDLGLRKAHLSELSPMIPRGDLIRTSPERVSASWVQVYRDLVEWAVLYRLIRDQRFATDTLIVRDGLLRSKIFARDLFIVMISKMEEAIKAIYERDRRKVFLVGIAKHSKVLQRYHLALSLEDVLPANAPRFVRIPEDLEAKAYVWDEWARGRETAEEGQEKPKFKAGQMYFVRFGSRSSDPIWTVDVLDSQKQYEQEIFGYLLQDAMDGFPIPYYPRCLQSAHEHASLTSFDMSILQREITESIREMLPESHKPLIDRVQLETENVARRRLR